MRNVKTFLKDIITLPPVLFPCVALFHVLWLVWATVTCVQQPGQATMLNALWMLGYTVAWFGVADQKKWGAFGYIGVTVVNIMIYLSFKNPLERDQYMSSIFLIDVLFCFFILFYFKRFR